MSDYSKEKLGFKMLEKQTVSLNLETVGEILYGVQKMGGLLESLQRALKMDFAERKARNPQYSLRAYARYLELSPTSLSLYLNNKRGLSEKARLPILRKLGYLGSDYNDDDFVEVDLEKLSIIADWFYFAILSLMETDDYKHEKIWIAKRLNISVELAREALDRLEKYGFIVFGEDGKPTPSNPKFKTPSQVRSLAIRKSHTQALDLAKESLEKDDIGVRDFSAVTVVTNIEKLQEARTRIKRFRRSLMNFLESGEKKEVFRLSIQLFPLTRIDHD